MPTLNTVAPTAQQMDSVRGQTERQRTTRAVPPPPPAAAAAAPASRSSLLPVLAGVRHRGGQRFRGQPQVQASRVPPDKS